MIVASFEDYEASWRSSTAPLSWRCLFVLPFWLQTVQTYLGSQGEPRILSVVEGGEPIGHVPLSVKDQTAYFMGIPDVCDYQDIVARPDEETAVMAAAIAHLKTDGVTRLDLHTLRPDALALRALRTLSKESAISMEVLSHDVTYETPLPAQWEDYLRQLNRKQRHEVRRKVRRLESHGPFNYRLVATGDDFESGVDTFLRLFQLNRADKADFMNDTMTAYFRELMKRLAWQKMLRLYILNIGDIPAAAVLCFDYGGVRYLYNSGYDAQFHHLSVGVLSTIFSIKKGAEAGCRRYDFFKGAEEYKKRIGGKETGLYRCKVDL